MLLLLGVLVYWMLNPHIYLFKELGISGGGCIVIINSSISMLIRNYLPDILWVAAVINISLLMKEKDIPLIYIYALLALPFLSEILQGFKVIPGTFDWYDILIYLTAFLISFNPKINIVCKRFIGTLSGSR